MPQEISKIIFVIGLNARRGMNTAWFNKKMLQALFPTMSDDFANALIDMVKDNDLLEKKLQAARTLWCDSKRDPETGFVDAKYYDQFEEAISKVNNQ